MIMTTFSQIINWGEIIDYIVKAVVTSMTWITGDESWK